MTERDGAAVRVHAGHVGAGRVLPAEHDRGEGLVDLDEVDLVDGELVALEQVLGGRDRSGEHEHRVAALDAGVDDPRLGSRPSASARSAVMRQERAGAVADLRRGAGGVERGVAVEHRLEVGERLERGVAEAFVTRDRAGAVRSRRSRRASARRSARSGCRSGLRPTRRRGAVLRLLAERVELVAGDAELLGDPLGALELRGVLVVLPVLLVDRLADERVLRDARAHRHRAHHLDAARHGDVDHAGRDQGGRDVRRLLRRAALGVDGRRRRFEREAGLQPRGAGDVGGLHADLPDATADDLADLGGIDAGPIDQPALHLGEQVGRVHRRQPPVAPPRPGSALPPPPRRHA